MKTTFRYLAAALSVIVAASCTQKADLDPQGEGPAGTYQYILNVTHENDATKTSMDGVDVLWNADDKIGVSCKYENSYKSAGNSGGPQSILNSDTYTPSTSAIFELKLTENYTPVAAAYPYFEGLTATSGKSVNSGEACLALIPDVQYGIKGNIPSGALAMVGKVENNSCQMYNVGAVIKLEITRDNIASLKFEGNKSEAISGKRYYYIKPGNQEGNDVGTVALDKDGNYSSSVTLVPSSGDVFEKGEYYFVVSPNNLTEGFTITLTTLKGQKLTKSTTSAFNIKRNTKYTNFGSDEDFTEVLESKIEQNLVFCEGTGNHNDGATINIVWPFKSDWESEVPNETTEFYTEDNPDFKYSFKTTKWNRSRAGFQYGGTDGDYLAILPVERYKVTYIKIRGGNKATTYSVVTTAGELVDGKKGQPIGDVYDSILEFTLNETSANTEYRLKLSGTTIATIREMWITYELVE